MAENIRLFQHLTHQLRLLRKNRPMKKSAVTWMRT